jgi:muramoyltetrapeptide carboxypeptidase LdcA involved in peptidoglycan recycling
MSIIPPKLKETDEIRIISPARSLSMIGEEITKIAEARIQELGFKVTFGSNVYEQDEFVSSSIESRIKDLHDAFFDKNVKGILTVIGGFSSNQLLKYIDYDLIKKNPKILCGYSDITALNNAIYTKTKLVTYIGPHFSTFGMIKGIEHIIEYFKKCLMTEKPFIVEKAPFWSDDAWYFDQEKRDFKANDGPIVINEGEAEGISVGGNLCTFQLLHGTEYKPSLKDVILFLEDDDLARELFSVNFDRDLQSIIHQPDFEGVKGIIIGRPQKNTDMTSEKIKKTIKSKKELENIPVIANMDFGHTYPMFTFPIGGRVKIRAYSDESKIKFLIH